MSPPDAVAQRPGDERTADEPSDPPSPRRTPAETPHDIRWALDFLEVAPMAAHAVHPSGSLVSPAEMVIAAVDDDPNAGPVVACARARSAELGIPLRLVHVWTEGGATPSTGLQRSADADRLLSTVLHDFLPPGDAATAERQVLHDDDPARALQAMSRRAPWS